MSEVSQVASYGYETDEVKISNLQFGLNKGVKLVKFEYITNAGKDGAEGEALEIVFDINGTEKSYRKFPVIKAFGKNQEEITDPNAPEFKAAMKELNATITHIMHCFVADDVYKAKISRPFSGFKEFCTVVAGLLPTNFATKKLDIFLQYQWQITGQNNRTFLEIPKKMSYGKWLCPSIAGTFTEHRMENPKDTEGKALYYVNESGVEHLFVKNGWFINSPFATQQKIAGTTNNTPTDSGTPAVDVQQAAANMNAAQAGTSAAAW